MDEAKGRRPVACFLVALVLDYYASAPVIYEFSIVGALADIWLTCAPIFKRAIKDGLRPALHALSFCFVAFALFQKSPPFGDVPL